MQRIIQFSKIIVKTNKHVFLIWYQYNSVENTISGEISYNIGFPGQFRNFVDQIHFMSIQFRRFGVMHNRFVIRFYYPSIRICIDAIQI